MGLTTAELTVMRDTIELLLPDTCMIVSVTRASDGAGGKTETLGTVGTSIPCRLDVKMGRKELTGGAIQPYVKTMLSLPYDQTITESHRVEHGGLTYKVIAPPNTNQSWISVKRVELERM